MNVVSSRLPAGASRRLLPGTLARLGVLNGVLGAALVGAGVASYFVVAGTGATIVPPRRIRARSESRQGKDGEATDVALTPERNGSCANGFRRPGS
jgi:hypothetical protein